MPSAESARAARRAKAETCEESSQVKSNLVPSAISSPSSWLLASGVFLCYFLFLSLTLFTFVCPN